MNNRVPSAVNVDKWVTPPECQGQIVEVSYGTDVESCLAWRRSYDRSDRSTSYQYADMSDFTGEWEPWNVAPSGLTWVAFTGEDGGGVPREYRVVWDEGQGAAWIEASYDEEAIQKAREMTLDGDWPREGYTAFVSVEREGKEVASFHVEAPRETAEDESVPARIEERGNGLPDVGSYVPGSDGYLYRVTWLGRMFAGSSPGAGNWIEARVELADWDDCPEDEEFPASVILESDEEVQP